MKNNNELLTNIERTLHLLHKVTCCKLDAIALESGGTPTLYNFANSVVVTPGNTFSSPAAHAVSISVIGDTGDTASLVINGTAVEWPANYSASFPATTEFEAGHFEVNTSTATVIINTITS